MVRGPSLSRLQALGQWGLARPQGQRARGLGLGAGQRPWAPGPGQTPFAMSDEARAMNPGPGPCLLGQRGRASPPLAMSHEH